MTRAVLGLGSNLGARWNYLERAVSMLREVDHGLLVSSVYESAPVGGPKRQGPFLNCVVVIDWKKTPGLLLELCRTLEDDAARVRTERWGPRTLDVDVLWVDGYESLEPDLTVPHPRLFDRAFVLLPLEEVAPDIVDQGWRTRLGIFDSGVDTIRRVGVLASTWRGRD